jgi:hypothetical protein
VPRTTTAHPIIKAYSHPSIAEGRRIYQPKQPAPAVVKLPAVECEAQSESKNSHRFFTLDQDEARIKSGAGKSAIMMMANQPKPQLSISHGSMTDSGQKSASGAEVIPIEGKFASSGIIWNRGKATYDERVENLGRMP